MTDDRERWDAKHAAGSHDGPPEPFVLRALDALGNLAPGSALDLASGTGRHALELARRGWSVSAWDVSPVGLGRLTERAAAEGLEVETRALDLVGEEPPLERSFDLVVVADFLDRPLYDRLHRLVPPGGHLVLTTFTVDHSGQRPPPEYRLQPGELAAGLPGFAPLLHVEEAGRALLVAARRRLASD